MGDGGFQWLTAGRGILHSEVPINGLHGLQLWVNLPKEHKFCAPAYQGADEPSIPRATSPSGLVHVKVLAGESMGKKSDVFTRTPSFFFDFKVDQNGSFSQAVPAGWNVFAYVIEGSGLFGPEGGEREAKVHDAVVFEREAGEVVTFRNEKPQQLRFVLVGGKPLNEPVFKHGPYVMNTEAEAMQAVEDFQQGRNGFETAPTYKFSNHIKK
jgi:redox-sensitive bicupin YhaK (pirin superfamily)